MNKKKILGETMKERIMFMLGVLTGLLIVGIVVVGILAAVIPSLVGSDQEQEVGLGGVVYDACKLSFRTPDYTLLDPNEYQSDSRLQCAHAEELCNYRPSCEWSIQTYDLNISDDRQPYKEGVCICHVTPIIKEGGRNE